MALSDLVIPTETFSVGGTTIQIRGLNVTDIAYLFINEREGVERFIDLWEQSKGEVTPEFTTTVLRELPDLVAKAIASACGEPDAWENAKGINGPTQLLVLNAIGRLTFEDVAPKKFLEGVLVLVRALTAAAQDFTPSTGTGG